MGDVHREHDAGKVFLMYLTQEGVYTPGSDAGPLTSPVRAQLYRLSVRLGVHPTCATHSCQATSSGDSWAGFSSEEQEDQIESDEDSWNGFSTSSEEEEGQGGQKDEDRGEQLQQNNLVGNPGEDLGGNQDEDGSGAEAALNESESQPIRKTSPVIDFTSKSSSTAEIQLPDLEERSPNPDDIASTIPTDGVEPSLSILCPSPDYEDDTSFKSAEEFFKYNAGSQSPAQMAIKRPSPSHLSNISPGEVPQLCFLPTDGDGDTSSARAGLQREDSRAESVENPTLVDAPHT